MNCPTRKIEHQTITAAQAHADSIFHKDGHQPNVYVCPKCGFFHVGGGRASDRPVHRPVPIVTTTRPAFVQKKIDKGHRISVDDLILEKLRTTFLTDNAIGRMLGINGDNVSEIRKRNKIPTAYQRADNAVLALLAANPNRNRQEIARTLRVDPGRVAKLVALLKLPSVRGKNTPRGPANPSFGSALSRGRRMSAQTRRLMSQRKRERTPEQLQRHKEAVLKTFYDPVVAATRKKAAALAASRPEVNLRRSVAIRAALALKKPLKPDVSVNLCACGCRTFVRPGLKFVQFHHLAACRSQLNVKGRFGDHHPMKGRHHTEETRRKIAEARRGKHFLPKKEHSGPHPSAQGAA